MKTLIARAALALSLLLAGCGLGNSTSTETSPATTLGRFGLVDSPKDHPLLAAAIANTTNILGDQAKLRLTPGWVRVKGEVLQVFAVTRDGFGKEEIMATHEECICVIAQADALSDWLLSHQGNGEALLGLDSRNLLTYMLLHEVGHVVHGDVRRHDPNTAATSAQSGHSTSDERAADEFAASTIERAIEQKGTDRGLTAAKISATLGQLSWNLSAHRLLDDFGGTGLNKPSLFRDGLSHPNIEWRILSVNAAITKSPAAKQLLDDFEHHRTGEPGYRLFPR